MKTFPQELKPLFAEIYSVPLAGGDDFISSYSLDEEAVSAVVEKEIKIAGDPNKVNLVTSDEFSLILVGRLRDRFGIPGAGEAQLNLYRDKDLMKKQLAKYNIRVPKHLLLNVHLPQYELTTYYQQLIAELGDVIVVKPVSGAGSIGTHVINHLSEFIAFYPLLGKSGVEYEVEEYIDGKIYHCDSVVQNGKILYSLACEYLFPNITYPEGKLLTSCCLNSTDFLCKAYYRFQSRSHLGIGFC